MTGWFQVVPVLSDLLDRIIPDPDTRAKAKAELVQADNAQFLQQLELALKADQNQTQINSTEAQHTHLFVSGWRPFIGWVCGAAFGYHYVLQPFLVFLIINNGTQITLPDFAMDELTTVLMGLLGLGSLRTIEKLQLNMRKK